MLMRLVVIQLLSYSVIELNPVEEWTEPWSTPSRKAMAYKSATQQKPDSDSGAETLAQLEADIW